MAVPSLLAFWVHDLSPFLGPHFGNIGIRYYGLAYLTGFVAAGWLLALYARAGRSLLAGPLIPDFIVAIVMGTLLGGRIGYFLLYQPQAVAENPLVLLRVWEGGMASHGGFVGVTLAVAWFARVRRLPFLHLGDLIASTVPIGLFFGRIANFLNGELWGKPAVVPWAVIFEHTGGGRLPRHPSQLYEAALEGLLLLVFIQLRFWKTDLTRREPGRLGGEFLLAYAVARALGEIFREPDASLILGLSRGTFYSLFLVVAGVVLVLMPKRPLPLPPA